ncbi:glycosyltransferase family 87 protein [Mucilaginibacter aquaedulcis]|uniref:glycosyltransferase family 87 protein n=1 Tax=Mucilaginibacter aquaedulcis TaxID=1187081 RepID=UPI0025B5C439|nr:glycosyltransferase family 87 protein [Mucilaginibacter aquaedulcis]MDN3551277.1 glycosyltransferase family 87 protein [Mucilaginibacter aquaedulcis]
MTNTIDLPEKRGIFSKYLGVAQKLSTGKYSMLVIWAIMAVFITNGRLNANAINNYLIFKYAFINAVNHTDLYAASTFYGDTNHYGPLFSLIMAPFAIMSDVIQLYAWQIFNVFLLFFAIHQLPLSTLNKNIICFVCTQELYTSLIEFQTNGAVAALIILSWVFIQNRSDFWAAFCIIVGLYVKLYGIVGIVFFLFSEQKLKFIGSLLFWAVILFVLPMIFFSPQFIINSYGGWYHSLVQKNQLNVLSQYQDVSVAGMIRRIFNNDGLPSLPFIAGGMLLLALPFLRISRYSEQSFRFLALSSILMFTVLFSSGSELVTYIIAFAGVGIWYMSIEQPVNKLEIGLLLFAIYFGSLFATDLFPKSWRVNIIKPYRLKVLPYLLVWLAVIYQMLFKRNTPTPYSQLN